MVQTLMVLQRLFKRILEKMNAAKIQIVLYARFIKNVDGVQRDQDTYLCSVTRPFTSTKNFKAFLTVAKDEIYELVNGYTDRGSGWVLDRISRIEVKAWTYRPYKGGCETMTLPRRLLAKKSLVSIKTNTDCFMYSVLAALHNRGQKKEQYDQYIERYDFSDVRGSDVSIESVKKFVRKNKISVNVYTQSHNSDSTIVPLLISAEKTSHINLFLYEEHYYWISSFKRLLGNNDFSWQRFFCQSCICGFAKKSNLEKHSRFCSKPQRVNLPKPEYAFLHFDQYEKQVKYPYIIYADFETLAKKTDSLKSEYQLLQAISFGYIFVDFKHRIVFKELYTGADCALRFIQSNDKFALWEINWRLWISKLLYKIFRSFSAWIYPTFYDPLALEYFILFDFIDFFRIKDWSDFLTILINKLVNVFYWGLLSLIYLKYFLGPVCCLLFLKNTFFAGNPHKFSFINWIFGMWRYLVRLSNVYTSPELILTLPRSVAS